MAKGKNPLGIAGDRVVVQPEITYRRLEIGNTPRCTTGIGQGSVIVITVASATTAGIDVNIACIQIGRDRAVAIAGCRRLGGITGGVHRHHHGRSLGGKAIDGSVRVDRAGISAVTVVRADEIGTGHHHGQGFIVHGSRLGAILYSNLIVDIVVAVIDPLCLVKGQSGEVYIVILDQCIVVDFRFCLRSYVAGNRICRCSSFRYRRSSRLRCFCRFSGCCGGRTLRCRIAAARKPDDHRRTQQQRRHSFQFHRNASFVPFDSCIIPDDAMPQQFCFPMHRLQIGMEVIIFRLGLSILYPKD